jgi:hypothetical protein
MNAQVLGNLLSLKLRQPGPSVALHSVLAKWQRSTEETEAATFAKVKHSFSIFLKVQKLDIICVV